MAKIRITKEFNFEMAHALLGYDGLCSNVHGHSYRLFVTISGQPIVDNRNPKNGMVIDFGELKTIIHHEIIDILDHALVLNEETKDQKADFSGDLFNRLIFMPFQPTCENLIIWIAAKLQKHFNSDVSLYSIKLHETANSFAEWYSNDN